MDALERRVADERIRLGKAGATYQRLYDLAARPAGPVAPAERPADPWVVPCDPPETLDDAGDIHRVARRIHGRLDPHQEHQVVLLCSVRGQLLGHQVVASGRRNGVEIEPGPVFRAAVRHGAAAIIAIHNHPSGDLVPSLDDLALTHRLRAVGDLLDVPLVDHVIHTPRVSVSLATVRPDLFRLGPASSAMTAP